MNTIINNETFYTITLTNAQLLEFANHEAKSTEYPRTVFEEYSDAKKFLQSLGYEVNGGKSEETVGNFLYDYTGERSTARHFFNDFLIDIIDTEVLSYAINNLVRYLQNNGFDFEDVADFYNESDLIDEYEIPRLLGLINIVDNPDGLAGDIEILKESNGRYLVISDDDEEAEI
ncbi:hypothetical protein [Staphylococcus equorum]|uniref:hypothetical protein n=1 Tax=Staphylococcus equorum TaxID=246432 RepID=UPI00192CF71C|nr:hypothetical protein [Staphylococcus equorum]